MLVVAGEALIDLVLGADGSVEASLGGAPYNTARAASRLGVDVGFVGCLSKDRFGQRLVAQLRADGVHVDDAPRTDAPTTLALAEVDASGSATYRFYLEGTSAPALGSAPLDAASRRHAPVGPRAFFTGGLALVLQPMADSIVSAVERLGDETMFVLDVNCRPVVIADRERYVQRLDRAVRRADVVKASDEDLAYLFPGLEVTDAVAAVLDRGARSIVVTAGAESTIVADRTGSTSVPVASIDGDVVDTIGAGDTFGAAMVASWVTSGLGRDEVATDRLVGAVMAGHAASAVVVTRRGADPPYRHELAPDWGRTAIE